MTAREPSLGLCLIVRDEARLLEACVESARPLFQSLIIVDTGSTDGTVALAERLGAQVIHFPWVDDFSAARNAALAAAQTDFVLFLDADERLDADSHGAVRALMAADDPAQATVYLPLIHNVDAAGQPLGADHMARLWRHRPELRFSGRIHEEVGRTLEGLRRVVDDRVRITHLGYDPQLAADRGKRARNLSLLKADLAERPDDPRLWFYLAKEHYAAGEDEVAAEGFKRVIEDGTVLNFALSSRVFGAECLRALERHAEALALAIPGLQAHPDYGELYYVAGMAAGAIATKAAQAEALLAKAVRTPTGVAALAYRDPSVQLWRAQRERARLLFARNAIEEGVILLQSIRPVLPEAHRADVELQLVSALLALGDERRAWALLEPWLEAAPDDAVGPLLDLSSLYVTTLGADQALDFLEGCATRYRGLLKQIAVVGALAELAELAGDASKTRTYLGICAQLGTPYAEHYLKLAKLLLAAGENDAAEAAVVAARRCLSPT